jgi:hypothetical protein
MFAPTATARSKAAIYVAVAARDGRSKVTRHEFGERPKQEICMAAMGAALDLLEEFLHTPLPRHEPPFS